MKLGKVFVVMEEARNFRDMLQSLHMDDDITNMTYEMPLGDCDMLADILDFLLDLVSTIEVVGD